MGRVTWMLILGFAFLVASEMMAVRASDPDPLQDFCVADFSADAPHVNGYACKLRSNVTSADFLFTGLRTGASLSGTGALNASVKFATVSQFPGLNTQGIAHARLDFGIGGVIPPHTHPLAAETLLVIKGTIYTGFISDDNVLYASTLEAGDITMFPKGTQHFQINVGKEDAITFNTLNSQNPGLLVTANQVFEFGIPSEVLQKSFGISAKTVKSIQASIPRYWG